MKGNCIWFLILVLFGLSCVNSNKKVFYITLDRVDGLTEDSKVESKGVEIGRVANLGLYRDKVLVKVVINGKYNIPYGSKFQLAGESILNSNAIIKVNFSESQNFYHVGDTINGPPLNNQSIINQDIPRGKLDSNSMKSVKKIVQGVNELLRIDSSK